MRRIWNTNNLKSAVALKRVNIVYPYTCTALELPEFTKNFIYRTRAQAHYGNGFCSSVGRALV